VREVSGDGIEVLHSYANAGWRHAVDRQWLRAGVLAQLRRAATTLPPDFGFAVFDAWRPLALQRELFDAINPTCDPDRPALVAVPSQDPETPPPHLTGGAVDITLTWRRAPLALGTAFDDVTERAATHAFEGESGPVRALRRLLYHSLRQQDFVVLAEEWWHFEYGTRFWSGLTGRPRRYGPIEP
jgi:D-alanyl-D-alanine dipeptidase